MKTLFLTCNWQNLVYINYKVNPEILIPFLPKDVEPVMIDEKTIVSMVCFQFSKAKFFGMSIPFHQFFPEINIRAYVQKKGSPEINGVYFLSEMTPKLMTVLVAKYIFGEPFSLKNITTKKNDYEIQYQAENENLKLNVQCRFSQVSHQEYNQEERFVIDRKLAFCGKVGQKSQVFRVQHRRWSLLKLINFDVSLDNILHLPKRLQEIFNNTSISSVFATDGSEVKVFKL